MCRSMLSLLKKGLKKQNFDSAHRKEVLRISLIGDYLKIVLYFKFSHLLYIESRERERESLFYWQK